MKYREITTEDELAVALHVLLHLRPHLNSESFREIYHASRERDGYTLHGAFEGTACVGLMGYRVLYDFVRGKHLYIDDLVVTPEHRSRGIGEALLKIAEGIAAEQGCRELRLCAVTENSGGIRFYERCGWEARAIAFKKALPHLPAGI